MRSHYISILLFAASSFVLASQEINADAHFAHQDLEARQDGPSISPDGSCGLVNEASYTCEDSAFGQCCGYNGLCGSSPSTCDISTGCLPTFGVCGSASPGLGEQPIPVSPGAGSNSTSNSTGISTSTPILQPTPLYPGGGRNGTLPPGPTYTPSGGTAGDRTGLQSPTTTRSAPSGSATGIGGAGVGYRTGLIGTTTGPSGETCSIYTRLVPIYQNRV